MIGAGRTFKDLICCLSILALSACGSSVTETVTIPVDVIFDSYAEKADCEYFRETDYD